MASEAFPRSQELSQELNKQTGRKKRRRKKKKPGSISLGAAGAANKRLQSGARRAARAAGRRQHRLMPPPLPLLRTVLRGEGGGVRAESRADRWSPASRASGGLLRALHGGAPRALPAQRAGALLPAGSPAPASEGSATGAPGGFPELHPVCREGSVGEAIAAFLPLLGCAPFPLGGSGDRCFGGKGRAGGARGQPRAQHARIAPRRCEE